MQDSDLLNDLLNADSEDGAIAALDSRGLLGDMSRWRYLGNTPNNQSVVNNQQSTAMAALVEKYTNGVDALLLRHCKAAGVDPRGHSAPDCMDEAVSRFFGDLASLSDADRRAFSEDNLLLYATGSKARPCISMYDNGEGQLPENFPKTFCSLISGSDEGSYKGAINFVQGRFNMGGTGVLPFCGEKRKIQLIVSRAPDDVVGTKGHEWAYTIICFFPSAKDPSWRYMVGPDGQVLTAGSGPLKLVPLKAVKSGVICKPLERAVPSGTLVKMYDFKAPRSNVCGELYKKLGEYLIQPAIPLRIIECRKDYQANVMGVTLWDRLGALLKNNELEDECRDGIGVTVELSTGEQVPAEVRVFRLSTKKKGEDVDEFRVGLRALINGQSHAKRGPEFVRAKGVGLEHIAGSMLVTLDCTRLCQQSRNDLFMANRETFRSESALCEELFKELKEQLRGHDALKYLNHKRYEEKVKTAVDDEDGIKAMEDLLAEDPELAELFGGKESGATSSHAPTAGGSLPAKPEQFKGAQFPSFFRRADGSTSVEMEVPRGGIARVAFHTDVRNNYFTRKTNRGTCKFKGDFAPSHHLYNGRLTLACRPPATAVVGTQLATEATITDPKGSGPFTLMLAASVVAPKHKKQPDPREKKEKKSKRGPSRPRIRERDGDPTEPPIEINREPKTNLLEIIINRKAAALEHAKAKRPSAEEAAVEFVFKYGLALLAMSMIDRARETEKWDEDEPDCRKEIGQTVSDLSRVIVPLCLNLPQKLPKAG